MAPFPFPKPSSIRKSIVCLGEALIDFVATDPGSLAEARFFEKAAGGAPANVAAGLARLGVPSAFVGKLGDDAFGRYLADVLGQQGVDVSGIVFSGAHRTCFAFVLPLTRCLGSPIFLLQLILEV